MNATVFALKEMLKDCTKAICVWFQTKFADFVFFCLVMSTVVFAGLYLFSGIMLLLQNHFTLSERDIHFFPVAYVISFIGNSLLLSLAIISLKRYIVKRFNMYVAIYELKNSQNNDIMKSTHIFPSE